MYRLPTLQPTRKTAAETSAAAHQAPPPCTACGRGHDRGCLATSRAEA